MLAPAQHLVVQGIPLYDERRDVERFAVELMAMQGKLNDKQIASLAGNGMSLIAVGTVLLFALGTIEKVDPTSSATSSPSPVPEDTESDGDSKPE